MVRTSLLLLAFLFLFSACSKRKEKIEGWLFHENKEINIQYPPEWELNSTGEKGTSFILLAPSDGEEDLFRENVNLLVQRVPADLRTLEQYINESESQVKQYVNKSEIITSERLTDEIGEYHKLKFTGEEGEYKFVFEQHVRIVDSVAYCLTFAAEKENYLKYKSLGGQILNSFYMK